MLSEHQVNQVTRLLMQATECLMTIYEDYVQGADLDVNLKTDDSPVTKADIAIHDLMLPEMARITPDIYCLSEESADDMSAAERQEIQTLWLLDPVDGTREYIKKSGQFTINLALVHKQAVVASWLVVPTERVMYHVWAGETVKQLNFAEVALHDDYQPHWDTVTCGTALTDQPVVRIGLSNSAQLSDYARFIDKVGHAFNLPTEIVRAGSAYKYALMLENKIDIYVRAYPTCEWDTASGQGLIEAVGGTLINFRGNPFLYNARSTLKNGGFVCFKQCEHQTAILAAAQVLVEEH